MSLNRLTFDEAFEKFKLTLEDLQFTERELDKKAVGGRDLYVTLNKLTAYTINRLYPGTEAAYCGSYIYFDPIEE